MEEGHLGDQDAEQPFRVRVTRSQTCAASKSGLKNCATSIPTDIDDDKTETTTKTLTPLAGPSVNKSRKRGLGTSSNADKTKESSDTANFGGINKLPAEILLEIFTHVSDDRSLRNCRLVCEPWRSLIDNNAALMRKFTFLITDPPQFLNRENNIASKVRAIRLQLDPCSVSEVKALFSKVGPTCEVLTFDMLPNDKTTIPARVMLELILSHFIALKELRTFRKTDSMVSCRMNSLSIHLQSADPTSYKESKKKLAHLTSLASRVSHSWNEFGPHLFQPIVKHMQEHPGVLKKLEVTGLSNCWPYPSCSLDDVMLIRLIAADRGVQVNLPSTHLNKLTYLSPEHEGLITPANCGQFKTGELYIHCNTAVLQNFNHLAACTNMAELRLIIERSPLAEELAFLRHLTKLKDLVLRGQYDIPAQVFEGGLESLQTLAITGYFPFSTDTPFTHYFPNLTDFELNNSATVPRQLVEWLVQLEKLAKLKLRHLKDLTDSHLMTPVNRDGAAVSVPIVAAFSCLKELTLESCPQLTKACWMAIMCCTSRTSTNQLERLELIDLAGLRTTLPCAFTFGAWKVQPIDHQLGRVILTKGKLIAEC